MDTYGTVHRPRVWPDPDKKVTLRGVWREFLFWLRPVGLVTALIIAWMAMDPAMVETPRFLSGEPEYVDRQFTQCRHKRTSACVIDGDTIAFGDRRVRIVGIDTAEVDAECPAEAIQAQASTDALQKLLNEGPFTMVGRIGDQKDRYGRDLRTLTRTRPDGTVQSIAKAMRESGGALRYMGGFRGGWC